MSIVLQTSYSTDPKTKENKMTNEERDMMLVEISTDIKWIKDWIKDQNKYKYMVWAALVGTVISLVVK